MSAPNPEYNFAWRIEKGLLVSPQCFPLTQVLVTDHKTWFNNFREHQDLGMLKVIHFAKTGNRDLWAQIPTRLARNQVSTETLKTLEKAGLKFVRDFDYNRTLMPVLLEIGT